MLLVCTLEENQGIYFRQTLHHKPIIPFHFLILILKKVSLEKKNKKRKKSIQRSCP